MCYLCLINSVSVAFWTYCVPMAAWKHDTTSQVFQSKDTSRAPNTCLIERRLCLPRMVMTSESRPRRPCAHAHPYFFFSFFCLLLTLSLGHILFWSWVYMCFRYGGTRRSLAAFFNRLKLFFSVSCIILETSARLRHVSKENVADSWVIAGLLDGILQHFSAVIWSQKAD